MVKPSNTFLRALATGIILIQVLTLYRNIRWGMTSRRALSNVALASKRSISRARGFATCPYEMCYLGENGKINVHIISHSHIDPGWVKTLGEYYLNDVRHIMDTFFTALKEDPLKRVISVETIFFSYWWNEQPDHNKAIIRELIEEGRIEFISGGWSVNDEASTHYSAIIDQFTFGFDFLKENFGSCGIPKIGWQVDTFGHSREQASIFAQFGFDGLFFARVDYQDYERREQAKTLESIWFGSDSLDDHSSLFTGIMYEMAYSSRKGFCFECFHVDKDIEKKGRTLASDFVEESIKQAKHYTTNHIMWMLGSDFQFRQNMINFQMMDAIIKTIAETTKFRSQINVFYSTPSCYLYALNKANKTYTSKSDDFFPYAHQSQSFWTGYFTSRPSFKRYERWSNNLLQVCKQLNMFEGPNSRRRQMVQVLQQAMALLQHHDAISGTSKQYVHFDYIRILSKGIDNCQEVLNQAIGLLLVSNKKSLPYGGLKFCNLLNVSSCPFTESADNFGIIVYNPLGHDVSSYLRLPVSRINFHVLSPELKPVESQMVPLSVATKHLPDRFLSNSTHELVFQANLPPLGYSTYFVETASRKESYSERADYRRIYNFSKSTRIVTITNEYLRLAFNTWKGHLISIENLEKRIKVEAKQIMHYYRSFSSKVENNHSSGAYIFRPYGNAIPIRPEKSTKLSIFKGALVTEVRQKFSKWAKQVTRLFKGKKYFEIEWTVGPLPYATEVISRFETSINNNRIFYTDSNGRQMMKRMRDYRPTWDFSQTEPIAGNYYPVNSRIYIQDTSRNVQLTVLTDRSQGGSSIQNGEIELMLHRRTSDDDGLGLDEALDDTGLFGRPLVARGSHYVILETIESSASLHRPMAQHLYMSPHYGFFKLDQSPQEFVEQYDHKWSGLKSLLPDNVHILTLEEWHKGKVLLRLEHYFEKNEDPVLSKPSTVSLKALFSTLRVKSAAEYTLGANKPLRRARRLQWNVHGHGRTARDMLKFVTPFDEKSMEIELKPMQIRTFLLTLE